jgi:hypothetical protein
LWVIFALLDPDPDPATQINADPCGSGSNIQDQLIVIKALTFIWIVCDPGRMGLDSSVADPGCLSRILIFIHPGSQIQQQQQKRKRKKFVVRYLFL